MFTVQKENLKIWQFENLAAEKAVSHFVTGRYGGVSEGETGSLNLSFTVPDQPENVRENRKRVADFLGVPEQNLIFPKQTHTKNIGIVTATENHKEFSDTDALITNVKGISIAVMSADCVPVLLYDRLNKAVAAIHAGWRGTVQKIVKETIDLMIQTYGTQTEHLIAGIGPSICQDVYEVGEEVIEVVKKAFGNNPDLLRDGKTGKAYLNLWEANRIQLLETGVKAENIEISGLCTFTNSNEFFSARKSDRSGRFAAGIMLQ
jgi:polyphenol oxidase